LYVADTDNYTIRKVVISTGVVQQVPADGTGSAARFYYSRGITTDGVSLYLADTSNNLDPKNNKR
jgi:hypothetical protein